MFPFYAARNIRKCLVWRRNIGLKLVNLFILKQKTASMKLLIDHPHCNGRIKILEALAPGILSKSFSEKIRKIHWKTNAMQSYF